MAAHPSTLAAFSPLSPGMSRAIRQRNLRRHCVRLGATVDELRSCDDTGDLWALRCRLLEQLMQPGDEAVA